MEQPREQRWDTFKSLPIGKIQERRRNLALERGHQARKHALERARQAAEETGAGNEITEVEMEHSRQSRPSTRGKKEDSFGRRHLMRAEWLVQAPRNLAREWCVIPRPQGRRCLVVATRGRTLSRSVKGELIEFFHSDLPSGSPESAAPRSKVCLLDCVLHKDGTYYAMDVMCWNGHTMYATEAEFRFFWLATKLHECTCDRPGKDEDMDMEKGRPWRPVVPLHYKDATPGNVVEAHTPSKGTPYERDGLAFVNKRAHYEPGFTPLSLVWKDESCSSYFIDCGPDGSVPEHQLVCLRLSQDGSLLTGDDPPIRLSRLPEGFWQSQWGRLNAGSVLRMSLREGGLTMDEGCNVHSADLHLDGVAKRPPDILSKIVFQHLARWNPGSISLQRILEAAHEPPLMLPG